MKTNRSARAAYIVLGETTYFRVIPVFDETGRRVGHELRQRVIVRDLDGVSRHAYRRVTQ